MELSCSSIKKLISLLKGKPLLYFRKWSPALSIPNPNKLEKPIRKKFLIFAVMELSSSNIEKILIFSQKKAFLIFSYKKVVLIFPETELSSSTPFFLINNKKSPQKSLICLTISKQFVGADKRRKTNSPLREQAKSFFLQRKPKRNAHLWTCQFKMCSRYSTCPVINYDDV